MQKKIILLLLGLLSANAQRLVGMAYFTWHFPARWTCSWGTLMLGKYNSDNRDVMRTHAEWLRDAGVDFIMVDWSNDIDYNDKNGCQGNPSIKDLELNTIALFEEFSKVQGSPKIGIMMGSPSSSNN